MGLLDTIKAVLGLGEEAIEAPRGMWAYHVTTWIGSGEEFSERTQELLDKGASHRDYPDEGPQRPNLPDYIGYMEDVTGQFVLLRENIPNPNVVVVKVGELRKKHSGSLSQLALDTNGVMLERQWEPDGTMTKHITDSGLKSWLQTQGFSVIETESVCVGERTIKVIELAKAQKVTHA